MSRLPISLTCLTVQHIIDDPDTIEHYLTIDPAAIEKCMSLALKEVFNMPRIPTATTTLKYLQLLWNEQYIGADPQYKYLLASNVGATYLLPFIISNPQRFILIDALDGTAKTGQFETMIYLLNKLDKYQDWPAHIYLSTFTHLIRSDRDDILVYLLQRWSDALLKYGIPKIIDIDTTFKYLLDKAGQVHNTAAMTIIVSAFKHLIPWHIIKSKLEQDRNSLASKPDWRDVVGTLNKLLE